MHLIHNERTKLTATWINTLAAAFIAAGAVAPVAAILYGLSAFPVAPERLVGLAVGCVAIGVGVHFLARTNLEVTRMSFETFALIWPAFVAALVVGFVFLLNWFEDRAERRKSR
jgi:hypothetical protein